mmetsp:Transcript_1367/g.4469  ORF Transcript_1367/g.4469 Transcript_1367/m.4469 type:complete len:317 (-) Transcript_1367:291-1241(-)
MDERIQPDTSAVKHCTNDEMEYLLAVESSKVVQGGLALSASLAGKGILNLPVNHVGGDGDAASGSLRLVRVGRASVVGDIQSGGLDLRGHTEHVELLQDKEEGHHDAHGPRKNGQDDNNLARQQVSVSSHDESVVVASSNEALGGKGTGGDESPYSGTGVDGNGIKRVVDLEHVENQLRRSNVDKGANDSDGNSSPDLDPSARSRDGHESGKRSVSDHDEINDGLSGLDLGETHDNQQRGQCTGGRTKGGVDSNTGGEARVASNSKGRTRVESEPSEPEEEDTEKGERGVVSGHINRLSVGIEASNTRAQHPGSSQ